MKESELETHFDWAVQVVGGKTYKFRSPTQNGVSDRIACFPDGSTWFVELKVKGGRIDPLQALFAADMKRLNQSYVVIWNKEDADAFVAAISRNGG
jgi:hypothetical protein